MQLNLKASSVRWELIQGSPRSWWTWFRASIPVCMEAVGSISSGYKESRWMTLYNPIPPCWSPLVHQFVPDSWKTCIVFSAVQYHSEDMKLLHALQNIICDCRGSFQIKMGHSTRFFIWGIKMNTLYEGRLEIALTYTLAWWNEGWHIDILYSPLIMVRCDRGSYMPYWIKRIVK